MRALLIQVPLIATMKPSAEGTTMLSQLGKKLLNGIELLAKKEIIVRGYGYSIRM